MPANFNRTQKANNLATKYPTGIIAHFKNTYDRITHKQQQHHVDNNGSTDNNIDNTQRQSSDEKDSSSTKRVCFAVKGSVGNTISPQSVLPDLHNFEYSSITKCPYVNEQFRNKKCELWKLINEVGDKKNTYKMWIHRQPDGLVVPVHYYMLGYDTLLSSHYDRYDVTYRNFKPGQAKDEDFLLGAVAANCGPMPGPGDDSSSGERRAHMIVQNPFHELIEEPHRYDHVDHDFDKFKKEHSKEYNDDTHHRRSWHNFMHNSRFINGKNRQLKQYKLKVNRFADDSPSDLGYLRGRLHSSGYNGGLDYAKHHNLKGANGKPADDVPEEWNWVIRGAVSPVKDQATCGSCWSFGTTGTIEGAYFVKTGKLPILSQQQMVDCSWQYGNNGCDGGEDFRAYKYIIDAGGLSTQEDYGHYLGVDGKCHDDRVKKTVRISGFYNVTSNDKEALKHAVKTYGPVTVAIDASRPTFTFYSHGVYYDEKCQNGSDSLDHQVLVVGYANIDGKFVWIVKNSWSTYWGDNGYIMMSAENNNCGVMDSPTVPIIEV